MSFPEELLELACDLQRREPEPNQAILRRAVSTAYYALFHLLIGAAVRNWAPERHRNVLARTFEHPKMKAACVGLTNRVKSGEMLPSELSVVARAFINLQEQRHRADYDNSHSGRVAAFWRFSRRPRKPFRPGRRYGRVKPHRIFCCSYSCRKCLVNRRGQSA